MDPLARVYACLQHGQLSEAERLLLSLLHQFPQAPAVHRAHAAIAQAKRDMPLAVAAMRTAVELAPDDAQLHLELGQTLGAAGDPQAAVTEFLQAAALQPDLPGAWYLAGMTLYGLHREAEGLEPLQRAHALAPAEPQVLRALAETEYALEHHARAAGRFEQLAQAGQFDDAMLHLRRSQCARRTGDPVRALALVQGGLQRFPDDAPLWLEQGWVHEDLGDAEQARASYARAHALQPQWADPLGSVIALDRASAAPEMVHRAETLADAAAIPQSQRAYLRYVLGKRADALGDYATAASHWTIANRLRREAEGGFDREAFTAKIDDAIAAFTPALLEQRRALALHDPRPVFVLGMPRSGTTLAEQILAAHPQVHGCGERVGIVEIADAIGPQTGLRWPQDAASLDPAWCRRQAEAYIAGASDAQATRLVDKQPYNFLHVGLLHLLFANARIVWCRRDPRDIALSIYSENFSPMSSFATDLDDIAFVIAGQERLMRHWQAVSTLPILELVYEDVVADVETSARRLVEFAGLDWDDACLSFHQSARPVQTLSRWQVRQPVHARSVGRWRHYPQWFAPP